MDEKLTRMEAKLDRLNLMATATVGLTGGCFVVLVMLLRSA